jgi:hypothetical protein
MGRAGTVPVPPYLRAVETALRPLTPGNLNEEV